MILTEVGEIGVTVNGSTYKLRPSLHAISELGSPAYIVEVFVKLMAQSLNNSQLEQQFGLALSVVHTCSTDDLSDIFGYYNERRKYVVKKAAWQDIIVIARELMTHGVIGVTSKQVKSSKKEYIKEFRAADVAAMAIAHLGMSEQEAWQLTMTGFVNAMLAKYPPPEEEKSVAPTIEEHDKIMAWADEVERKQREKPRLKKNG